MAPATGTAFLILVAFVLPGFVALAVSEKLYVRPVSRSPLEYILLTSVFSSLSYVILGLVVWVLSNTTPKHLGYRVQHEHIGLLAALGFVVVFVLPVGIAVLGWRFDKSALRCRVWSFLGLNTDFLTLSGWDYMLKRKIGFLVRVRLSDGRMIGGRFGFHSFIPLQGKTEDLDLFLEERWSLDSDDWFIEADVGSLGVWIPAREIVSMEMYTDDGDLLADSQRATEAPGCPEAPASSEAGNSAPEAERHGRTHTPTARIRSLIRCCSLNTAGSR